MPRAQRGSLSCFNHTGTIATIGSLPLSFNADHAADLSSILATGGAPLFGAAYIIPSMGGNGKGSKLPQVCQKLAELAATLRAHEGPLPSHGGLVKLLTKHNYIGEFLAYQMCVDIGYIDRSLYDEDKHVVVGPGAKKGLKLLYPTVKLSTALIEELRDRQPADLEQMFASHNRTRANGNPILGLMAIENMLCEFSKYSGFVMDQKRPKRNFKPSETKSKAEGGDGMAKRARVGNGGPDVIDLTIGE